MKIRLRLYIYLLIFIGIALYLNSLTNLFIGDDFDQIVDNTSSLNPSNFINFFTGSTYYGGGADDLTGLYYRPIMLFFYSVIYSIFGLKPIFFHLLQLLLHISNSILLFILFKNFFKNPVAFFLSLIFLIHPINTESVVYIANFQEVLFLFFGLIGSILVQNNKIKSDLKGYLILTLILLLSLFSKETGILFAFIYTSQALLFKKLSLRLTLFSSFTAFSIYFYTRFIVADISLSTQGIAPIINTTFSERLLNLPAIIFYYLATFIFPLHLSTTQFWLYKNLTLETFFIPLFIITLLLFLLFITRKSLIQNKLSLSPFYLFTLWLILGLALHTQIFPLDMTVADRWFYFPIIGLLGIIGIAYKQIPNLYKNPKITTSILLIILILLSYRTYTRSLNWRDPITLYEHDTKIDSSNFFLENSLGTEYLLKGKYDLAEPHIKKSVQLFPYFGNLNNMAVIESKKGNTSKTKYYLERAIQIDNNFIVTENYAKFLYTTSSPESTIKFIKSALINYPNNATLWMYYGLAENKLGNTNNAIEYTKKAYELTPNDLTKSSYDGVKGIIIK